MNQIQGAYLQDQKRIREPLAKALMHLPWILAVIACTPEPKSRPDSAAGGLDSSVPHAVLAPGPGIRVDMRDAAGRALGNLTISETPEGLDVSGVLRGLPPGAHALHLHTVGLCQPPFTSAGDHWNPTNRQHGTANPMGPHLGDLPNITVLADSSASVAVNSPGGTLRRLNPLLDADGASLVIHAGPDDNRTDPSGNSGGRIACGVVRATN